MGKSTNPQHSNAEDFYQWLILRFSCSIFLVLYIHLRLRKWNFQSFKQLLLLSYYFREISSVWEYRLSYI